MEIDLDRLLAAVEDDSNMGFCINCGEEHYNCEPDAREYTCECCGKASVYGAEELLMMQ